jgi:hypothetical protein
MSINEIGTRLTDANLEPWVGEILLELLSLPTSIRNLLAIPKGPGSLLLTVKGFSPPSQAAGSILLGSFNLPCLGDTAAALPRYQRKPRITQEL